ncbi:MAG: GNAT family N-acetyltransferase [Planctomycetes bacterium]|nr:GNAT family N-acetyltransferase [Planctomycetota bacterium]
MIRDATRADLAVLRDLFLQARRETFHWTDPLLFRLQDFDIQTEGEAVMVAEVEGLIAGFVSWWAPENFVHHLFVGKSYMRRGIGKSLLQAALSRMEGPARLKCSQRNESAIAFYVALGWRVLEPGHSEDGPYFLMEFPGRTKTPES